MTVKIDSKELAVLDKLPIFIMNRVADAGMRAMAQPIIAKGKSLAPRGQVANPVNKTPGPTRDLWSQKYKSQASWQYPSAETVTSKFFKAAHGGILYVGAKSRPEDRGGNKQQFSFSTSTSDPSKTTPRREVFWGRDNGTLYVAPGERYMLKAFDETRSQALSLFTRAAVANIEKFKGQA